MSYNILLADDDAAVSGPAEEFLTLEGWNVTCVEDGEKALAALGPQYDALLLDVKMPRVDGYEVLRRIQERDDVPDLCVVMLTAFGEVKHAVASVRSRAYTYLEKPIELKVLAGIIEAGIAWRRAHALRRHILLGFSVREAQDRATSIISKILRPKIFHIHLAPSDGQVPPPSTSDANESRFQFEVMIRGASGQSHGRISLEFEEGPELRGSWEEIVRYLADLLGLAVELENRANEIQRAERMQLENTRSALEVIRERIATQTQTIRAQIDLLFSEDLAPAGLEGNTARAVAKRYSIVERALARIQGAMLLLNRAAPGPPMPLPKDLSRLLGQWVREFDDESRGDAISISTDPSAATLIVPFDETQIRDVVRALLRNASDSIKERRRRILDPTRNPLLEPSQISVSLTSVNDQVEIKVDDTGVGIPEEDQERIFKPMFSTKSQPDTHGLDLFTARQIVLAHHGQIGFNADRPSGASFWVRIPRGQS